MPVSLSSKPSLIGSPPAFLSLSAWRQLATETVFVCLVFPAVLNLTLLFGLPEESRLISRLEFFGRVPTLSMCLPLIVTFLSAVPFIATQGREITCSCTTTHCRESGIRTCNTTGLCFSQYLDRRDGSDPLVRGCIESRTPLLCENRRPAVAHHRDWPVLICCDENMCNARVVPTLPTSTVETSTEYVTPSGDSSDIPPSTQSTSSFREKVYLAVVLVGIFAVISIVVLAIFLTRRQATLYDPEFGRVGTNGYVKGCSEPPTVVASKGLDNKFALDT